MTAYYNEIDPFKAEWLRVLVREGHIAPGVIDERSIIDVQPGDLAEFTQCHFFAGIGVWSYALRQSGWSDDSPVWTGSCPCQSFSASGKREGFDDPRHLWPAWFRLLRECRPDVCFGEQVASGDGLAWFDVLSSDLEGAGYALGASDLCAAGVGAPHKRQRLYFVADTAGGRRRAGRIALAGSQSRSAFAQYGSIARELEHAERSGLEGLAGNGDDGNEPGRQRSQPPRSTGEARKSRRLADADRDGARQHARELPSDEGQHEVGAEDGDRAPRDRGAAGELAEPAEGRRVDGRRDTGNEKGSRRRRSNADGAILTGFWRDAEWIYCTDEKWRAVEPGTFPLAHGAPARVGRLRGYGDAIVAEAAATFIQAYLAVSLDAHNALHATERVG